jgi:TPR repeat protein
VISERATSGDLDSIYHLAEYYHSGLWITRDVKHAIALWRRAAEAGHLRSQERLGRSDWSSDDIDRLKSAERFKWCNIAAERGSASSQEQLGQIYQHGTDGITQDTSAAITWYRRSAEAGNVGGQVALGELLGTDESESVRKESSHWLLKAAMAGSEHALNLISTPLFERRALMGEPGSMFAMGTMLILGIGYNRNIGLGLLWLTKAAKCNHADAMNNLAFSLSVHPEWLDVRSLETEIGDEDLPNSLPMTDEDEIDILQMLQNSANAGSVHAMYNFGIALLHGRLNNSSFSTSIQTVHSDGLQWVELAAVRGFKPAITVLRFFGRIGELKADASIVESYHESGAVFTADPSSLVVNDALIERQRSAALVEDYKSRLSLADQRLTRANRRLVAFVIFGVLLCVFLTS